MLRSAVAFLFCCISTIANAQHSLADLDWPVIRLEWQFIKQAVGAPPDLPMPEIVIEPLPPGARMMFQFPTIDSDEYPLLITINPETLVKFDYEMVNWGLGHELTHYAFIMRDNNWDPNRSWYVQSRRHHCDPEFMQITHDIAEVIYNVYHGQRERYAMWDQVQRSCQYQPNQ